MLHQWSNPNDVLHRALQPSKESRSLFLKESQIDWTSVECFVFHTLTRSIHCDSSPQRNFFTDGLREGVGFFAVTQISGRPARKTRVIFLRPKSERLHAFSSIPHNSNHQFSTRLLAACSCHLDCSPPCTPAPRVAFFFPHHSRDRATTGAVRIAARSTATDLRETGCGCTQPCACGQPCQWGGSVGAARGCKRGRGEAHTAAGKARGPGLGKGEKGGFRSTGFCVSCLEYFASPQHRFSVTCLGTLVTGVCTVH